MTLAIIPVWIDRTRLGLPVDPGQLAVSFGFGFAPWLLLFPVIFAIAERHAVNRTPPLASLLHLSGLALAAFGFIMAYLMLVFAPISGQSVAQAIASQLVTQWLWDGSFFLISYMTGRLWGQRQRHQPPAGRIAVKSPDRVDFVPIDTLQAVTGQGNYVALISKDREILHRATLAEMETLLVPHGFCRVHRSHLVRPAEIVSVRLKAGRLREVTLQGDSRYPVSDSHADHLAAHIAKPLLSA